MLPTGCPRTARRTTSTRAASCSTCPTSTMSRFMDSANYALQLAMASRWSGRRRRPAGFTPATSSEPAQLQGRARNRTRCPTACRSLVLDLRAQPDVRAPASCRPERPARRRRGREVAGKVASIFSDAGAMDGTGWRAPGRARASAAVSPAGHRSRLPAAGVARWFYEGQTAEKRRCTTHRWWHRPNLDEVYLGCAQTSQSPSTRQAAARLGWSGQSWISTPTPAVQRDRGLPAGGRRARANDGSRLFSARGQRHATSSRPTRRATEDGMPGYAVPVARGRRPVLTRTMLAGWATGCCLTNLRLVPSAQRGSGVPLEMGPSPSAGPAVGGGGPRGPARLAMRKAAYGGRNPRRPREDAERLLRTFSENAYRRPVAEGRCACGSWRLFDDQFRRVPGFNVAVDALGLHGRPGVAGLRVHRRRSRAGSMTTTLATRLASVPVELVVLDDTLRTLGGRGELNRPEVLRAQAERILDDARAPIHRGVHSITGSTSERSTTRRRRPLSTTITSSTTR